MFFSSITKTIRVNLFVHFLYIFACVPLGWIFLNEINGSKDKCLCSIILRCFWVILCRGLYYFFYQQCVKECLVLCLLQRDVVKTLKFSIHYTKNYLSKILVSLSVTVDDEQISCDIHMAIFFFLWTHYIIFVVNFSMNGFILPSKNI